MVGLLTILVLPAIGLRTVVDVKIAPFFDSPELESLNYHQVFDVIEIYVIASNAPVTNDNPAWSTVSSYWKEKSNEQPGIH